MKKMIYLGLLYGAAILSASMSRATAANFTILLSPVDNKTIYEGDSKLIFYSTICDPDIIFSNLTLQIDTAEPFIAKIDQNNTIGYTGTCTDLSGSFSVTGVLLGKTQVIVTSSINTVTSGNGDVIVLRQRTVIDDVYRYGIIVLASILYIGFGCKVDIHSIVNYLKKPISPAIGIACQFLTMPLIGFGIGQLFTHTLDNFDVSLAFGLLLMSCSPGGGSSNVWANLLGGDMDLSVTMTTLSTFLSLGMMPLWIFALGRVYLDPSIVEIPYMSLARSILTIVIPLAVGIIIRKCSAKTADKFALYTKPFSGIFILYALGFGLYVNWYMFEIISNKPVQVIPSAILLPLIGYISGFALAKLTRRTNSQAVTISLETGVQNAGIPIVILQGSFPQPEGDVAAVMPIAVAIFYTVPIVIAWIIYTIYNKLNPEEDSEEEKADADGEDNNRWDNMAYKSDVTDEKSIDTSKNQTVL